MHFGVECNQSETQRRNWRYREIQSSWAEASHCKLIEIIIRALIVNGNVTRMFQQFRYFLHFDVSLRSLGSAWCNCIQLLVRVFADCWTFFFFSFFFSLFFGENIKHNLDLSAMSMFGLFTILRLYGPLRKQWFYDRPYILRQIHGKYPSHGDNGQTHYARQVNGPENGRDDFVDCILDESPRAIRKIHQADQSLLQHAGVNFASKTATSSSIVSNNKTAHVLREQIDGIHQQPIVNILRVVRVTKIVQNPAVLVRKTVKYWLKS